MVMYGALLLKAPPVVFVPAALGGIAIQTTGLVLSLANCLTTFENFGKGEKLADIGKRAWSTAAQNISLLSLSFGVGLLTPSPALCILGAFGAVLSSLACRSFCPKSFENVEESAIKTAEYLNDRLENEENPPEQLALVRFEELGFLMKEMRRLGWRTF